MTTRADIVAEALSWRGTPHQHQQSVKGRGCDCKGLVWGVARQLNLPAASSRYARMCAYHGVDQQLLREGLEETFDRGEEMRPGDVLLLRMKKKPQHLAILGDGVIVHTYAGGLHRVVHTLLEPALRLWPVDSVWCWRGLDGV